MSVLLCRVQRANRDRPRDRLISFSSDRGINLPKDIPKTNFRLLPWGQNESSCPSRTSSKWLNKNTTKFFIPGKKKKRKRWFAEKVKWISQGLFRFTAICGLIPLYALLTVRGRWKCPRGPRGAHPQSLEASALGTNPNVAAPPRDQGSLLCESVGEGLGQTCAPA